MSVLPGYEGIARSGSTIQITQAPEGETELTVGTWVQVAGVDDAGSMNVILEDGEWRVFDPKEFEWVEIWQSESSWVMLWPN